MKITREDVLRVAELAHLELTESEIEMYARQLDSILSYAEKLNELDTGGVGPMNQVVAPGAAAEASPKGTPLRDDRVVRNTVVGDVLAGAPDPDPPYFRVPKVIDR
jgi:aspartyl-tRNA(Asn)/glutamyl-tRNA(Gln) amidotransferase subunit C